MKPTGISAKNYEDSWSRKMLNQIAPKNVVTSRDLRHYIEPTDGEAIKRFYLEDSNRKVVLELYPGDTAEQAVPFYEKLQVEGLVAVVSLNPDWKGHPNFHLGYYSRNFRNTYTKTTGNLERYLKFWQNPPVDLQIAKAKKPEQYARLIRDLIRHHMMCASDSPSVKDGIKNRPWISLRPGAVLKFTWGAERPTAKEVTMKINEALGTWGESVVAVGSGKSKQLYVRPVR